MRVLVVEDHKELAATIAVGLRREGMAVDVAFDGEDGARRAPRATATTWSCSTATCRRSTATRSAATLVAARLAQPRADADRRRHDRAPRRRAQPRRRRLPAQAVRVRRARRAHPRARAAQPARRCRRSSSRGDIRLDTAQRVATPGRPPARAQPQGARGARAAARRRRRPALGRASCSSAPGTSTSTVLERRQGHDQPAATQARRAAGDRDRPRRLPDRA